MTHVEAVTGAITWIKAGINARAIWSWIDHREWGGTSPAPIVFATVYGFDGRRTAQQKSQIGD